ncbi:Intermembrane lipid transfer protein VPS13-like C-terminal domain-containing protein [Entamoeba marina]
MSVRFKFRLKAKGLNINYLPVNFTLNNVSLNVSTVDQIINFNIGAVVVKDVNVNQCCLTGGDSLVHCFSFSYNYFKKNKCSASLNSLTIQLIPAFINNTYESIQPVIERFVAITSQTNPNDLDQEEGDPTESKRKALLISTKEHSQQLVKDTLNKTNKFVNETQVYPSLIKNIVEETKELFEVDYVLKNTKLMFMNYEGNGLTTNVSIEGIVSLKGTDIIGARMFSQDIRLSSFTPSRKVPLTIIQMGSLNASFDNVEVQLSNRDIETTLMLLTEFNQSIKELFVSNSTNTSTIDELTTSGYVFGHSNVIKTQITSNEISLPTMEMALSYDDVKLVLISEYINHEGRTIDSIDALTFTSENGLLEMNKQQFEATINKVKCDYYNSSLGIKEPLIEPFDIHSTSILPYIQVVVSPLEQLLINITPEFVFTLKNLIDNWAKVINPDFVEKKGICVIANSVGVSVTLYSQNIEYVVGVSKTIEIPFSGLPFVKVRIEKYDPIQLDLKQEKCGYILVSNNKECGYIVVKTKTFQNSQIIKLTSPIHFENHTSVPLQIHHQDIVIPLLPNNCNSLDPEISSQLSQFIIRSPKYPRNSALFTINSILASPQEKEVEKEGKTNISWRTFICSRYLVPIVVHISPILEIVNKLPFRICVECEKIPFAKKRSQLKQPSHKRGTLNSSLTVSTTIPKKEIVSTHQSFEINAFDKGSITVASSSDSIIYTITLLEIYDEFYFSGDSVESTPTHLTPSKIELPMIQVGKHHFRQIRKGNQIIIECPYFLKNETQLPLSIQEFGYFPSKNGYQIYAPFSIHNSADTYTTDILQFTDLETNQLLHEDLTLQLGEEKTLHIKSYDIFYNIYARVIPYSNEEITTLCVVLKPHFLFENKTNEIIELKYAKIQFTLYPNEQIPFHFLKALISLKNGETSMIDLGSVDEYQILLSQQNNRKIFNIKTTNFEGTFTTTITGCSIPFLKINNLTNQPFTIKQIASKNTLKVAAKTSVPFAWFNPSQKRIIIIDGQAINPIKLEEETMIGKYRVLIDIDDNTTVITIGAEKRKKEQVIWTFSLQIPSFGINIFREKAVEEIALTINEVRMVVLCMDRHIGVEFQFDYLQIDSQALLKDVCPVIVSPTPLDWIYNPNESYFHIGLLMATPLQSKLLYISKFSICIQPTEVFLEPIIIKRLYDTFKQYPTGLFPQHNDTAASAPSNVHLIIGKAILNSWNINFSIGKACSTPSKHAAIFNAIRQASIMGIDRLRMKISQQMFIDKFLSLTIVTSEILESLKTDVDSMKWVLIGKLFGFRTLARKSEDVSKKQSRFYLNSIHYLPPQIHHIIFETFGRIPDSTTSLIDPTISLMHSNSNHNEHMTKTIPQTMVKAQQSALGYSVKDGTKNFGKSLVRGVKGLWKTPVGLTELAGTQNKKLAPVGFMGGVVIGAAGVFVKPFDGAIGFFKSLNDGLTGISFGQIAKERSRPPRYCCGSLLSYNYFESQGRLYMFEADDYEYYNSFFITWIRQVKESVIHGIIFTSNCMFGITKIIGSKATEEWKIPYNIIHDFGFNDNKIVVQVTRTIELIHLKEKTITLKDWDAGWIPKIVGIIQNIEKIKSKKG